MSKILPFIAFFVCSGLGVVSFLTFGVTLWLCVYAACAAVNIPAMIREL